MSLTPLLPLALAAAVGACLQSGAAAQDCYGLDALRVCVTNEGSLPNVEPTGSSIEECVHVGSSCTPVSVPVPKVTLGEGSTEITCYRHDVRCW